MCYLIGIHHYKIYYRKRWLSALMSLEHKCFPRHIPNMYLTHHRPTTWKSILLTILWKRQEQRYKYYYVRATFCINWSHISNCILVFPVVLVQLPRLNSYEAICGVMVKSFSILDSLFMFFPAFILGKIHGETSWKTNCELPWWTNCRIS